MDDKRIELICKKLESKGLPESKMANLLHLLTEPNLKIGADLEVTSFMFYFELEVHPTGWDYTGYGKCGGILVPGTGVSGGDITTDDADKLFHDTVSCEYTSTTFYTSVVFFDSHSNVLGHFDGASISFAVGEGGGTFSWKPKKK